MLEHFELQLESNSKTMGNKCELDQKKKKIQIREDFRSCLVSIEIGFYIVYEKREIRFFQCIEVCIEDLCLSTCG